MKILHNKKAIDYGALMMLVVAISFVYLSYSVLSKSAELETPIGAFATGIYSTYQESQKQLFFIKESAQLAATKALYELANNAGFGENNCGKQGEYYLWNKDINLCERNVNENYLWHFNKASNEYLKEYQEISYDFFIDGKELNGIATENLVFDIKLSNGNKVGKYSIKPSFKIKLEKDLSDYQKVEQIAKQILNNCASEFNEECITKNAQDLSFRKEGDFFLFDYNSNFKSKFEKENLKIKFALRIPLVAPEV